MNLDDIHEWDEVLITGTASSPAGRRYENFSAMVATVDRDGQALKVWPMDEDGKVWFLAADIERIEVTRRDGEG